MRDHNDRLRQHTEAVAAGAECHEWSVVGRPFCIVDGCEARAYVLPEEDWDTLAASRNAVLDELYERVTSGGQYLRDAIEDMRRER